MAIPRCSAGQAGTGATPPPTLPFLSGIPASQPAPSPSLAQPSAAWAGKQISWKISPRDAGYGPRLLVSMLQTRDVSPKTPSQAQERLRCSGHAAVHQGRMEPKTLALCFGAKLASPLRKNFTQTRLIPPHIPHLPEQQSRPLQEDVASDYGGPVALCRNGICKCFSTVFPQKTEESQTCRWEVSRDLAELGCLQTLQITEMSCTPSKA